PVPGTCGSGWCSPWFASFPPPPPPRLAPPCSAASSVLRRDPTPLRRTRPACGSGPSRTGPHLGTPKRSPGSRACSFSACLGSTTTRDHPPARDVVGVCVAFPLRKQGWHPDLWFSQLDTLPTDSSVYASTAASRLPPQDSRPGGSLLLSCKALSSSTACRFIPAHCQEPFFGRGVPHRYFLTRTSQWRLTPIGPSHTAGSFGWHNGSSPLLLGLASGSATAHSRTVRGSAILLNRLHLTHLPFCYKRV